MDLHKASEGDEGILSIEEIKRCHMADVKIQAKYGVRFIQYWINSEAGMFFCLMEGPDKESCMAVHEEAHGNMACNIIELQGGDYNAYMGNESNKNEFDLVENPDGTLDTGFRVILMVDVIAPANDQNLYDQIKSTFKKFEGREANHGGDRIMCVFNFSSQAIECAKAILAESEILNKEGVEVRIGISAGGPVSDGSEFFGNSIKLANKLCDIAQSNQIIASTEVKELTKGTLITPDNENSVLRIITPVDEKFVNALVEAVESMESNSTFSVESLSKSIGMSKAQLYRKTTSLTGHSPNYFIQEQRLKKALKLIKKKTGNIAEIAFEVGFSSPSYFTKSFQNRFGILPTQAQR
ncbi:transcriptional regulator containing an amidase domain and an AraC-type DNA-binding HTH domain [Solitalea canadensis DSM 3403]|uniref:Transcriptional regulator containing an amidase domain and an AraC-type DNA-binding HTH domain n=2 Tax=Solitalea canadensis TaxID=995 RepID=H8KL20_SOLCM|nr:transcriptional regulator containing an amidase domain and an AraC-type DNA-binding HTH domain [Solitalea canadensis DSM 3403]